MSEGAICAELGRLIFAHRDANTVLEPEVLYRHIPGLVGIQSSARTRVDLVLSSQSRASREESYPKGSVHTVIEVKHRQSPLSLVWEDLDYLGNALARSRYSIRGFLIYGSEGQRPTPFTGPNGAALKPRVQETNAGVRYKVRRVCRSVARIPKEGAADTANYAILLEVLAPAG